MKHRFFLLLIFLFLLLLIWNSIHYLYQFQKKNYQDSLGALPLILFSAEQTKLDSLSSILKEKNYVESVEQENNEQIVQNLIHEYELNDADTILDSYSLPFILKIYFRGDAFDLSAKKELKSVLDKFSQNIRWRFNDTYWIHFQQRILLLNRVYFYFTILIAIILLVFGVYFRVRSEIKQDFFWKVYQAAGGKYFKRRKVFFLHSVLLTMLPVLLNYGIYYFLSWKQYLIFEIDLIYFGYETGFLLFLSALSGVIVSKRL